MGFKILEDIGEFFFDLGMTALEKDWLVYLVVILIVFVILVYFF